MAIQVLPESVQSFIRSGITIPSPVQAVEELILNSLDAGASSISVHIDFKYYKIQVTDNGCGMSSDQLELVGDRYMTSKCHSLEDIRGNLKYFGYRGEALAAIREISGVLSIVSRAKGQTEVFCKLFVQGKSDKVEIYDIQPHDVGTTVTIQDFMFNLPVRRTSIREALEMEEIRACVESIAIIHPQVTFSVHNDGKGSLVFQKHITSDILTSFTHIFGQLTAQSLAPISFLNGKFRITGFVGKYPSRHKHLQFLYINKRSLRKTKIHTLINNMLAKSSILRGNGPNRFKPIPEAMNAKSLISFTKLERNKKFAVFIIQIQCDFSDYEISFDPKKTSIYFQDWSSLTNSIELCIRDFLKREKLVLSEEPVTLISKTVVKCDALKELEELENETLSNDNIPSNDKSFDDVPFTHFLLRAVHGLPAKRKKEKAKSFPVSKNLTKKISSNLGCVDNKRICINEKPDRIYFETTDKKSRLLDLESNSESNHLSGSIDQNIMNKSNAVNECLEASTNEYPITYSGESMCNVCPEKIIKTRKKFSKLTKFAANNDIKKKKLRSVNQDEGKQKVLTSHNTNRYSSDVSVLSSTHNLEYGDASFRFSPRIDLKLEEVPGEQLEFKLNESLENKIEDKIVSLKNKSIFTTDDFIHTLENENEKVSNKVPCKCKKKYVKSFDYNHSRTKFSEESMPTNYVAKLRTNPPMGIEFNYTTVSENFQIKEDSIPYKKIKELYDKTFQNTESKLKCLIKSSHSHFEGKNKYGVQLSHKNKLNQSSEIITSPYFYYEPGKRITEAIGKEVDPKLCGIEEDHLDVNLCSTFSCHNREDMLEVKDFALNDSVKRHKSEEQEADEYYPSLNNSSCCIESMKNTNFDYYNSKSYDTGMFDSFQRDLSRIHNNNRNSTLNCKEIDSSFCSDENSINYSPDLYKTIDSNNIKADLKNTPVKRIKQVSLKHPLTECDKIDYEGTECNTETASVVSQNEKTEQFQIVKNKQIEFVLKSNKIFKSPYFCNTHEGDRPCANRLVENVSKESYHTDYEENYCNSDSASVVLNNSNCEQLQLIKNKQFEVVFESNKFLKSPYFRNTHDRFTGNKLLENEGKISDKGTSINIDNDRGRASIEDYSKNISENIHNESETVINIGESNKNSLLGSNYNNFNNPTFHLKKKDCEVKAKTPDRNNSIEHHCIQTSSTSEKVDNGEIYSMEDRFMFLPKGMSPILQYTHCTKKVLSPDACQMLQINLLNEEGNDDDVATVKWRKIFGSESSGSKALIKKLCVDAENGLKMSGNVVKDGYDKKLLKLAERVSEIMKPFHYTKTIFFNYKIIGQCDKKFILIYCSFVEGKEPHIIGAFDQHAVHERIRVEALLKDYMEDDGIIFKTSDLDCELSITLSGKEFRIVIGYKREFERLGLLFQIEDDNRIKIIRVPTCLYNRYLRVTSKRLTVLKDLLQNLITDHVEFLLKTHGVGCGIPEVLLDVINSEACRGAVKFGDPLSDEECTQMLNDLACCNKPFYCAHGRPTFCPIFDMNELYTKRPIMFNKLKPRC